MQYIFLDNFRGFRNSLIPMLDVSFCVGENSSGKTSFLSALSLFASQRFWFEQSFEGSEAAIKHFSDYVSVGASDKSYFRLGIASDTSEDKLRLEGSKAIGYLFTYAENEGMPGLVSCTTNVGKNELTVYFGPGPSGYQIFVRKKALSISDFAGTVFKRWAKIQDDPVKSGLKAMPEELPIGFAPPLYLISLLAREIIGKKSGHRVFFPEKPFASDTAWIAPIRMKPRRTYDEISLRFSPEGTHVPYLIRKILDSGKGAEEFTKFLQKFGKESGLFKEVNIRKFGESATSPFELEVVLEEKPLNMSNVGYGVSQGLPVIVEAFVRPKGTLFAIQQPEVHLHPRAQASIGEMIFTLAVNEQKKFVVETHSDFTIDRYRTCIRESQQKVQSQVLFFERRSGRNEVSQILIENDGELSRDQPGKYRDFFLKESLRVIGL